MNWILLLLLTLLTIYVLALLEYFLKYQKGFGHANMYVMHKAMIAIRQEVFDKKAHFSRQVQWKLATANQSKGRLRLTHGLPHSTGITWEAFLWQMQCHNNSDTIWLHTTHCNHFQLCWLNTVLVRAESGENTIPSHMIKFSLPPLTTNTVYCHLLTAVHSVAAYNTFYFKAQFPSNKVSTQNIDWYSRIGSHYRASQVWQGVTGVGWAGCSLHGGLCNFIISIISLILSNTTLFEDRWSERPGWNGHTLPNTTELPGATMLLMIVSPSW